MANAFANLPAPAGDGVGAAVDTSDFAARKTIAIDGPFEATITIEVSEDNVDWAPIMSTSKPGKYVRMAAAAYMRVRVGGLVLGSVYAPNVDVAADEVFDGQFGALAVPAADGVGAALDVTLYPEFFTIIVAGVWSGGLTVEVSEDNIDWVALASWSSNGRRCKKLTAAYMRVRRVGTDPTIPGTPTVTVGAVNEETPSGSPIGPAGGDLTGSTYPNPTVSRPRLSFVYRPNAPVVENNIYDDWEDLMDALDDARPFGDANIIFDATYGALVIPAGGPYNMAGVTWKGGATRASFPQVSIADGATFIGLLRFKEIFVTNNSPNACALADEDFILADDVYITTGGAAMPLWDCSALTSYFACWISGVSSFGLSEELLFSAFPAGVACYMTVRDATQVWGNIFAGPVGTTLQIGVYGTACFVARQDTFLGNFQKFTRTAPEYRLSPEMGAAATGPTADVRWGDWCRMDATLGSFTQVLPRIRSVGVGEPYNDGKIFIVTEVSGVNGITLDGYGTETIEGALTYWLPPGGTYLLMSDGISNTKVIALNREALLNQPNLFTKSQGSAQFNLTDALAGVDTDAEDSNVFFLQLTVVAGNTRQINNPSNLEAGKTYMWVFRQPVAGATQGATFDTYFLFPGGAAMVLTATNSAIDVLTAVCIDTNPGGAPNLVLLDVSQLNFS